MKIQTFSIVAGTRACNARCPFCVSRMTGFDELPANREINERNFHKAALLAERAGSTTVLITGKGEPTLYPDEITKYLTLLKDYRFPLIELQTNGLAVQKLAEDRGHLMTWHLLGLDTVALSVVSHKNEDNAKIYHKDYPDLAKTIATLHEKRFSVRLCLMAADGYIDSAEKFYEFLAFCHRCGVEQCTVRPIREPSSTCDSTAARWVRVNGLNPAQHADINRWVASHGTKLLSLMHGGTVWDVNGQNVCTTDCLTLEPDSENIRTLIFYSDGRISYDWQHPGAVLVGGR